MTDRYYIVGMGGEGKTTFLNNYLDLDHDLIAMNEMPPTPNRGVVVMYDLTSLSHINEHVVFMSN
jgi:hypothetical protein